MHKEQLYLRVIDSNGKILLIKDQEFYSCDSIDYRSDLSSYELLKEPEIIGSITKSTGLTLKENLKQVDYQTVRISPTIIPYYALINDVRAINVLTDANEKSLIDMMTLDGNHKALMYGRVTTVQNSEVFLVDILLIKESKN